MQIVFGGCFNFLLTQLFLSELSVAFIWQIHWLLSALFTKFSRNAFAF